MFALEAIPVLVSLIRQIHLLVFDFDGVFTDNMVYVAQDGTEMVRCSRADGTGLRKVEQVGIRTLVISTETNPVVSARCKKLNIPCIQGTADKRATLDQVMREQAISLDQVAFVGNDVNDVPLLNCVGLPMVVRDAHPDVLGYALYRTVTPGGHGAVREVCDLFHHALVK